MCVIEFLCSGQSQHIASIEHNPTQPNTQCIGILELELQTIGKKKRLIDCFLNLAHGWHTSSGRTRFPRAGERKCAILENCTTRQDELANRQEKRKVQESNTALCLSAPVTRALRNRVIVQVHLVAARVHIDSGGNGSSTGKSKHKVQKVNSNKGNGKGKELDKTSSETVENAKGKAENSGKETEIDLGVGAVTAVNEGCSQAQRNNEQHKQGAAKNRVEEGRHCEK